MVDGRIRKYDYLRSISCFSIVLLHVSSSYWGGISKANSNWIIMTVYNAISRFAVPVFMMLSGTFMLEPKKDITIKGVLLRFGKLLINFYIWAAFFCFSRNCSKINIGQRCYQRIMVGFLAAFSLGTSSHVVCIFDFRILFIVAPGKKALRK